jgi:hypothetical protein
VVSFFQNALIALFAMLAAVSVAVPMWSIFQSRGKVLDEKDSMPTRRNTAGQITVTDEWKKFHPETEMSINPLQSYLDIPQNRSRKE